VDHDLCYDEVLDFFPVEDDMAAVLDAYSDVCGDIELQGGTELLEGDDCEWTLTRTWYVVDECGNGAFDDDEPVLATVIHSGSDQTAPEFLTSPADQEVYAVEDDCSQVVYIVLPEVADNCDDDINIFEDLTIETDPYVNFSPYTYGVIPGDDPFPVWFVSGLFTQGQTTVTMTLTDHCGNEAEDVHVITVTDNTPPSLKTACPESVVIGTDDGVCDASYTFTHPQYEDNCQCASSVVSFCDEEGEPIAGLDPIEYDGNSGNFAEITRTYPKGVTTVKIVATDDSGNVNDECTFTIEVYDDEDPVFTYDNDRDYLTSEGAQCPADVTTDLVVGPFPWDDSFTVAGITVDGPASSDFMDNCPEMYLSVTSIEISELDPSDPGAVCDRTVTIVWTATDCGDLTAEVTQVITITDDVAPVAPGAPTDEAYQCVEDVPAPGELTAVDACQGDITVTGVDSDNGGAGCADDPLVITRTWTFDDGCGNVSSTSQTITVVDDVEPQWDYETQIDAEYSTEQGDQCPSEANISLTVGQVITAFDTWFVGNVEIPNLEPSVSDNCTALGDIVITVTGITDTEDGCDRLITVSFNATDECGNVSGDPDFVCSYRFVDDSAPEAPEAPADEGYQCVDDVPAAGDLTAPDNCQGDITVTGVDSDNGGAGCTEDPLVITRTWTFDDGCGNVSTISQTITVIDDIAPEITAEASDETVECDGLGNVAAFEAWLISNGGATAEDNCTEVWWSNDYEGETGSCSNVTVTINFDQYPGETSWDITDVSGAVVGSGDSYTEAFGTVTETVCLPTGEFSFNIYDSFGDGICCAYGDGSYSVTNEAGEELASGSDFGSEETTGFSVAGDEGCGASSTTVTFTAKDDCGNSSTTTATFNIVDTQAPSIDTEAGAMIVECDGEGNVDALEAWLESNGGAVASDVCSGFSWSNDFTGLSDDCGATGSAEVIFTATDACGNASTTMATFTIVDTQAPEFITFPESQVLLTVPTDCNQDAFIYVPEFGDACDEMDLSDISITADPYVNFGPMSIDINGNAYWNGDFQVGVTTVTLEITDDCGLSTSQDLTITVIDNIDPVNVTACPDDQSGVTDDGLCSTEFSWTNPFFDDNCDNVFISIQFTSEDAAFVPDAIDYPVLNTGMGATETATFAKGTTTVCYHVTDLASHDAGVTTDGIAFDEGPNTAVICCFDIYVEDNQFPTASDAVSSEYVCVEEVPAPDPAVITDEADNCPDLTVEFNADASSMSGSGCAGDPLIMTRAYDVIDCDENTITVYHEITVMDDVDPTASDPETIVVDCLSDVPEPDVEVVTDEADNCEADVVVAWVGDSEPVEGSGNCGGLGEPQYTITREYSVTDCDGNGNSISVFQTIEVNDNTAPVAVCVDITVSLDETGKAVIDASDIDGGSSDACGDVTLEIDPMSFTCENIGDNDVVLTVTDGNCNESTCTATVTVVDDENPVAICPAVTVQVELDQDGNGTLAANSLGDGSSTDNCEVTESNEAYSFTCEAIGFQDGVLTATDGVGNTNSITCQIEVVDLLGPEPDAGTCHH